MLVNWFSSKFIKNENNFNIHNWKAATSVVIQNITQTKVLSLSVAELPAFYLHLILIP